MKDSDLISQIVDEVIRKSSDKDEWCLYSKKKSKKTKKRKNLGCYKSKKGAKERERQVGYFKSISESHFSDKSLTLAKSPIHGIGVFSKSNLAPHTNLGPAQIKMGKGQYTITPLGKYHNHSPRPSCYNKMIGNKRYLFTARPVSPGEEITIDYRLQPDLEQPKPGWAGDINESNKSLNILNDSIELPDIYLWEKAMTTNNPEARALLRDLIVEEKKKKKSKGKDKEKYGTDVANSEKEVAKQDAWAGGDNLNSPIDWMKVGGIKLKESQLRRIVAEELEGIISEGLPSWMTGALPPESGGEYRRRRRVHDIGQHKPGTLDRDVEDTGHQLHVVALQKALHPQATWSSREVVKLPGQAGGYTDVSQLDDHTELNSTIRNLKMKYGRSSVGAPKLDIQVWQETSQAAPQFQTGGRSIDPTPIPGATGEVGVMLFSV